MKLLYLCFALMVTCSVADLLPDGPIIVGYTDSLSSGKLETCVEKLTQSLYDGVNVMIWSFINMAGPFPDGNPSFKTSIKSECVQQVKKYAHENNFKTVHIVSVGGWNAKHPSTIFTAEQWWNYFQAWNKEFGFDGIDWDIEGTDDQKSNDNHFTKKLLDLMGELSHKAKTAGKLVSMAPPQSYMDHTSSLFDLSLLNTDPHWSAAGISFSYHAHNTYTYLLAVYGDDIDLVMPQLYETYSNCAYALHITKMNPATYLEDYVKHLAHGYTVDFSQCSDAGIAALKEQKIMIRPSKLVIGLANGWANNEKGTSFISASNVKAAYQSLVSKKLEPKGFMFWSIGEEGHPHNNVPIFMAKELNKFLQVRQTVNKRHPSNFFTKSHKSSISQKLLRGKLAPKE